MAVFQGNSVEAAINAGLAQLGVTREQVTIKLLSEPKKGFLGIGKKAAEVELTLKPVAPASEAVKPASQALATPKSATKPVMSSAPKSVVSKATAPASQTVKKTDVQKNNQVPNPRKQAQRQAANEQALRDLSAYLLEIVKRLGISADLDVEFANREATLNFETQKQGLLIGKHGRTINSLQDLAQVYMNHHGASHVNVTLDVDDYRERRQSTLKRLADSTAREVIATGKQVYLDPMPSFERKLIHAELADNRHVTTFSEGRDPHRAVVVAIQK